MLTLLLELPAKQRNHISEFRAIMKRCSGPVLVVSPYITDSNWLSDIRGRETLLLTSVEPNDFVNGASSYEVMADILRSQVKCRYFARPPLLHAKVYIFGDEAAVVTSANLTEAALCKNIEAGVVVTSSEVEELKSWFRTLWESSQRLTLADLEQVKPAIEKRKRWIEEVTAAGPEKPRWIFPQRQDDPSQHGAQNRTTTSSINFDLIIPSSSDLRDRIRTARECWICNTNRKTTTFSSAPLTLESLMREQNFAAAWPDGRKYRSMEKVQEGDFILMFASKHKDVQSGIVGIGIADHDGCEKLEPSDPKSLRNMCFRRLEMTASSHLPEWRIKIDEWLYWNPVRPLEWHGSPGTFMKANKDKLMQLLAAAH